MPVGILGKKLFSWPAAILGATALFFIFLASPRVEAQTVAPRITNISPASAVIGTVVTIFGSGFSADNAIVFGSGLFQPDEVLSATQMTFTVPSVVSPPCSFDVPPCEDPAFKVAPGTFPVSVAADATAAVVSNSQAFNVLATAAPSVFIPPPPPVSVSAIDITSGPVGTIVTLTGSGFSEFGNMINFGPAAFLQMRSTASTLKFKIPPQALPRCALSAPPCPATVISLMPGRYQISVSPNANLKLRSNAVSFTVTAGLISHPAPVIASIDPTAGLFGAQVTIKGSNFSPNFNFIDLAGGFVIPRFSGDDLIFDAPQSVSPRCFFNNPPCISSPPITVKIGTYNIDVVADNELVSNAVPFTINPVPIPADGAAPQKTLEGEEVKATANVIVRDGPSLGAAVLATEAMGSLGIVASGPVAADGHQWLEVFWDDGTFGWSSQKFLAVIGLSSCAPLPGHNMIVSTGDAALSLFVRPSPSFSSPVTGAELPGAEGIFKGGPVNAEGFSWWQIEFTDGISGWVTENGLINISCFKTAVTTPLAGITGPKVTFEFPTPGSTVFGAVPITVSVISTGSPVTKVDFFRDGLFIGSVASSPYTFTWDSQTVFDGPHTLTATAFTAIKGLTGTNSITVKVTGGLSVPEVDFISPLSGAVVSGLVPLIVSVVAPDPPVTKVDFYADGVLIGSSTASPYTFNWDSTKAFNGLHTLSAVARTAMPAVVGGAAVTVKVTGGKAPPSVGLSFITPEAGAIVSGLVPVEVAVSSTVPVVNVKFQRDGLPLGSASVSPYAVSWDATKILNGVHTLTATVQVEGGLTASKSITVKVTGGISLPTINFISPTQGATVSGLVSISASANSPSVPITKVDFYLDGALLNSDVSSPYTASWDASKAFNGSHVLGATVFTATPGLSATKTITVNVIGGIPAPFIGLSFISPAAGANVYNIVPINVAVSSTVAISKVDFYVDNALLGSAATAPYTLNWNTAEVELGPHTLLAVARTGGAQAVKSISVNVIPAPLLAIGDRVEVQTGSNLGLNVRAKPSTVAAIIATRPNGKRGTVADGPVFANDFWWWRINYDDGVSGWSVESYFVKML